MILMDSPWTCIDDKLPEPNKPVVICGGRDYETAYLRKDEMGNLLWLTTCGTMSVGWYRYWMPIPELSEHERKDANPLKKYKGGEDYWSVLS